MTQVEQLASFIEHVLTQEPEIVNRYIEEQGRTTMSYKIGLIFS